MNVIVFMDSDLGSRSEGRSFRHKKRVDYAKMQKGKGQVQEEVEKDDLVPSENQTISGDRLDIPFGASNVQTASGTASAVSGEEFSFFHDDREQDEEEMASIALQMSD